jgi:hypothetical protein
MWFFGKKGEEKPVTEVKTLHYLRILDHTGHTEVAYDPADPVAVASVKEQFDAIMASQHGLAYTMENGEKGAVVRDFDPTAKEMYVAPQIVGG